MMRSCGKPTNHKFGNRLHSRSFAGAHSSAMITTYLSRSSFSLSSRVSYITHAVAATAASSRVSGAATFAQTGGAVAGTTAFGWWIVDKRILLMGLRPAQARSMFSTFDFWRKRALTTGVPSGTNGALSM